MSSAFLARTACARIPTGLGQFQLCHFLDTRNDKEHLALIFGHVEGQEKVLTRVHSECFTGDVMGSQRCDCGEQLQTAMRMIAEHGAGVILYLRQEGRGIGLEQKLLAYNLQDQGFDTVDANLMLGHQADEREYSVAAGMLQNLDIRSIRLMTNNPDKIESLENLGIIVDERVALEPTVGGENAAYLSTKVQRMRHLLSLTPPTAPSTSQPTSAPVASTNGQPGNAPDLVHIKMPLPATPAAPSSHVHPDPVALRMDALAQLMQTEPVAHELRDRPFVTLTYAQTLDGSIACDDGSPLQISGPESMHMTHKLRTTHDAILVGIGTVLSDNPRLTARLATGLQPQPVILDTHFRLPKTAALLQHPKGVWLATHQNGNSAEYQARLADFDTSTGLKLLDLPLDDHAHIDLHALLARLWRQGVRRLMVEGGARVIRSFLAAQLVDYLVVTVSPRFVGGKHLLHDELRHQPTAESRKSAVTLPALDDVHYTQSGQDTILWAIPRWKSEQAGYTPVGSTQGNNSHPG